jgi:ribosomal protein L13E
MTGAQLANSNLTSANFQDCTLTDATPPAKGRWGGAKLSGNIGTAPMKQLGFSCAEVKAMGMVQGLKAAGYTCAEAKQGGYTCAEARQGGYTCAEAKQAGYTCAEAKQAGFNPRECMQAGFTHQEGQAVGYPSDKYYWDNGEAPAENRTQVDPRLARPPPPPPSARRGGPRPPPCRRVRPAPCVRPAGVASPRCRLTPARARGVLAWRRREI